MFELDLDVKLTIQIPDDLNTRLEAGEAGAFGLLENYLIKCLNLDSHLPAWMVTRLQIEDAGPHNVIFNDSPPSKR